MRISLKGGLSATHFAVFCGRDAARFVEGNRKSLGIGVANLLSDVRDTERRVQQEVFGSLHTASEQVLLEPGSHFLFEQHAEIIDRIMELEREVEQGEVLVQVIMNPGAYLLNEQALLFLNKFSGEWRDLDDLLDQAENIRRVDGFEQII